MGVVFGGRGEGGVGGVTVARGGGGGGGVRVQMLHFEKRRGTGVLPPLMNRKLVSLQYQ
jgi:hypothetical protein